MDKFSTYEEKICPDCQEPFVCEVGNEQGCWCMQLPPVLPVGKGNKCLCPDCLSSQIKTALRANPGRVITFLRKNAEKTRPEEGPFRQGLDYYINEDGFWVFTTFYHLKKGYCCQNGCKHCPYGFKKIQK